MGHLAAIIGKDVFYTCRFRMYSADRLVVIENHRRFLLIKWAGPVQVFGNPQIDSNKIAQGRHNLLVTSGLCPVLDSLARPAMVPAAGRDEYGRLSGQSLPSSGMTAGIGRSGRSRSPDLTQANWASIITGMIRRGTTRLLSRRARLNVRMGHPSLMTRGLAQREFQSSERGNGGLIGIPKAICAYENILAQKKGGCRSGGNISRLHVRVDKRTER